MLKENKVESLARLGKEPAVLYWERFHQVPLFSQDCSMDPRSLSKCFKYGMHTKGGHPRERGVS
eukprot:4510209-Prorocentrum_lima.AAC.1